MGKKVLAAKVKKINKTDNRKGPPETLLNVMWQPGWYGSLGESG